MLNLQEMRQKLASVEQALGAITDELQEDGSEWATDVLEQAERVAWLITKIDNKEIVQ